jgi:formylmethanofuran dehydrogenase subunit C
LNVTLTFDLGSIPQVDRRALQPAVVLGASLTKIEKLPATVGNQALALAELCRIRRTEGAGKLVLAGDTSRLDFLGWRMESGRLIVVGDAGDWVGAEMCGGAIEVGGDAGDCLGLAMQGGLLRVAGRAGERVGAAHSGRAAGMMGGVILVGGNAGREVGAGMRSGVIQICGNAGEDAGMRMLAGTIGVAGGLGKHAGVGMRRGSILAGKSGKLLPGFLPSGPADEEWLRIYLRWAGGMGLTLPVRWLRSGMVRFTGDHLGLGKGEILIHEFVE